MSTTLLRRFFYQTVSQQMCDCVRGCYKGEERGNIMFNNYICLHKHSNVAYLKYSNLSLQFPIPI